MFAELLLAIPLGLLCTTLQTKNLFQMGFFVVVKLFLLPPIISIHEQGGKAINEGRNG